MLPVYVVLGINWKFCEANPGHRQIYIWVVSSFCYIYLGCIIIVLKFTTRTLCQSWHTSLTGLNLHGKTQNVRVWVISGSPLMSWVRRGSVNWFMVLPLLSFSGILGELDFISSYSAQSMMCAVGRIHNRIDWRSCSFFFGTIPYHNYADLLTCIEHIWWNILDACVNVCWVYSVESVSKVQFSRLLSLFSSQYVGLYVLNWPIQVYLIERIYLWLISLSSSCHVICVLTCYCCCM